MRTSGKNGRKLGKKLGDTPVELDLTLLPTGENLDVDLSVLQAVQSINQFNITPEAGPSWNPGPPGVIDLTGDDLTTPIDDLLDTSAALTPTGLYYRNFPYPCDQVGTDDDERLKYWFIQNLRLGGVDKGGKTNVCLTQLIANLDVLNCYLSHAEKLGWDEERTSTMLSCATALAEEIAFLQVEEERRPVPVTELEQSLLGDQSAVVPDTPTKGVKRVAPELLTGEEPQKKKRKPYTKRNVGTCLPTISPTSQLEPLAFTADQWPKKTESTEEPTPTMHFYPPGDTNTLVEIYRKPAIEGASIRQYIGKPYERRMNLSKQTFKALCEASSDLLTNHERITHDGANGRTTSDSYIAKLNPPSGKLGVLVNLYRGKAKVHLGTLCYIFEMATPLTPGRKDTSAKRCGYTISLNTLKDIHDRVGASLTKQAFW